MLFAYGQQKEERGRAFFRYYPPKEYSASTQNWCFTQADNGLLYFGNNDGVLEFDGTYWNIHPIDNSSTVRSIAIEPATGIIYLGAQSEFGYLKPAPNGELNYQTLTDKIEEENIAFNDVWGTIATDGGVFFSSNEALFYWNGQRLKTWKAPENNPFDRRIFNVNDRLFINQTGKGLMELQGFNLEPVKGLEFLGNDRLAFILPTNRKQLLIGTRSGNIFFWDETKPLAARKTPFIPQWHQFFKEEALYRGVFTEEGQYVFSTITGGVVVVSEDGADVNVLKEQFGIDANVYYANTDRDGDLWICLNKGIIKVEYASALTKWDLSSVQVIRHQGEVYSATGKSFYHLNKERNRFERIGNKGEQTWQAMSFSIPEKPEPMLWVVDNSGLYEVRSKKLFRVAGITKGLNFLIQDQDDPHIVYTSSNEGLVIIKYENGSWKQIKTVPVNSLLRNLQQAPDGSLWAGTYNTGYVHIQEPLSEEPTVKIYFDKSYNIPLDALNECFVWRLDDRLIFVNGAGAFNWNGSTFEPDSRFEDYFRFASSRHLLHVGSQGNYIWVSGENSRETPIARAKILPDGSWQWELVTDLQRIPESLESFLMLEEDGRVWISNSEGIFLYDPRDEHQVKPLLPLLIREVRAKDSVIHVGNGTATLKSPRIPSENNSLIFRYSVPFFESEQGNLYQYQLIGVDEDWSAWTDETKKEYINLWEGEYTFQVRARNAFGQESEVTYFTFRVLPPWYRSWWAYVIYLAATALAIWLVIQGNTQRVRRKNRMLEEIVAERTHKIQEQTGQLRAQKEEVERAYENVKTLSDIGQQITAELNTEMLIRRVYENVNNLMEAEAFGIGVVNRDRQQLEFRGFIEKGEELPFSADRFADKDSLAVICYQGQKEIIINEMDTEIGAYLGEQKAKIRAGEKPLSLIYLPLVVEDTCLGVLTVQSFQPNAYTDRDITLLRTLASYVAIALANARMYGNIQTENRKTTDSLRYAQTIQNAILPPTQELSQIGKDYFVIFRPRDIVSGDFYWALETDGCWFVAVVDCTGHGVPGAFMSMIGHSLLNEIINERHVLQPVKILEELNRELRTALRQEDGANEDGMDIALCRLERQIVTEEVLLTFSGAGQSLFYYEKDEGVLSQISGERKSIGGRQRNKRPYKEHRLLLAPGSSFYIYSDGIVDQNNPKGDKFGTNQLRALLERIADLPMNEQFTHVNTALNNHQQEMEQRDDITFLGVRI